MLNNADFTIKNAKQKLPKEVTKNQRIVYLIEKYEKRMIKNGSFASCNSLEEEKEQTSPASHSSERRHSWLPIGITKQPVMDSITEEEALDEEEIIEN